MDFTGERFVPGIEDTALSIEHFQRYMSVAEYVAGLEILDAASGEGYGSNYLAKYAKSVVGVDISGQAVQNANEKYAKNQKNLVYKQGSVANLHMIADGSLDAVVSFETIEHIEPQLQEAFLREIKRILKPRGILIMSTPNREIYSDRYNYHNEFHIKEFYKDEFVSFLKQEFANVVLYNQFFEVTANIDSMEEEPHRIQYFKNREKYKDEGKYFIALASNAALPDKTIASVFMNEKTEYAEKTARILELQGEVEQKNSHLTAQNEEIGEKDARILELQEEVEQKNSHIAAQNEEIGEKDARILELQGEVEQKNSHIAAQNEEIGEKGARILELQNEVDRTGKTLSQTEDTLLQREETLEQVQQELLTMTMDYDYYRRVKTEEMEGLATELRNKEGHIELLLESDRELERIKNSRTYRLSRGMSRVSGAILPYNSKRRLFVKIAVKFLRHPVRFMRVVSFKKIKNFFFYLKKDGAAAVSQRIDDNVKDTTVPLEVLNVKDISNGENRTIEDYEKLHFVKQTNPKVSIVIPVYNQFDYTYHCLKSILANSGEVLYEIIIGNDCSTDLTAKIQECVSGITVVNNETNLKFLKNCNNAAKYARGEYILFLNNDTQVQGDWLWPLVSLIESEKEIGMVGSKLVYADGRLQEAGGILWKDGSAWNYGNRQQKEDPEYNYVKEADYISGAAIMIRRNLWEEIGGFDETFAPAYYEDTDLAFEVRKHGYKVMYQPKSVVVHFEGVSNGTDTSTGLKSYQVVNAEKFYEKWKDVLEKEHFVNAENVYLAKDRGQTRKQILVVDHYVPNFDKDAGGRCTFMYIQMFLKMGLKVTFIGDNFAKPEPYTDILTQMGVEVLYGNYYYNNWKKWLSENLKYFDYVYLQRPHISIKYIDLVKKFARGKIFYFAHDLHHVRLYRDYQVTGNEESLKEAEKWKKIELELFEKADVGHVVGSYEQEVMQKIFPDKPIRNIPLYIYDDEPQDIEKDFSKRKNILFVGGFNHQPNVDAVLWFAQNVFPKLLEAYPDLEWHIVGSKAPSEVLELASERIILEGFVSDEELGELYRSSRIVVVPLRYGAGVKGKVVEAAYYQIPVMTTSIGGEGIDGSVGAFLMEDDAERMAQKLIELYNDYEKLRQMSDNGKKLIDRYYNTRVARETLLQDM